MTLDEQITEAEQAEDAARRQFKLYEDTLAEARFALTTAVDRARWLKMRREILFELNRTDLLSRGKALDAKFPKVLKHLI